MPAIVKKIFCTRYAAIEPPSVQRRDQCDEHQQRHEGADVGREEVVHRDADGVGGDDLPRDDLLRIGGGEDPVVRHAGQNGLCALEDQARDDVLDRDRLDLVPEILEPPDHIDAGKLQDPDDDGDAGDPGGDPHESAGARLADERRRDNT